MIGAPCRSAADGMPPEAMIWRTRASRFSSLSRSSVAALNCVLMSRNCCCWTVSPLAPVSSSFIFWRNAVISASVWRSWFWLS